MSTLKTILDAAVAQGVLLKSSLENIMKLLGTSPLSDSVISELVEQEAWDELNDRFYILLNILY